MKSNAKTVSQYLAGLPAERRAALQAVREVILANLDQGFSEGMAYGMIGYAVPHSIYPPGYHCDPRQPLPFAALSSQKHHMGLGIMSLYGDPVAETRFRAAWAKSGRKKLDMGKVCIRFKKVEDLALDVIAETIRSVKVKDYIERYEKALAGTTAGKKRAAAARAARQATTASSSKEKASATTKGRRAQAKPAARASKGRPMSRGQAKPRSQARASKATPRRG